jgi:squalene/oxidosqualene cyclase-like protein
MQDAAPSSPGQPTLPLEVTSRSDEPNTDRAALAIERALGNLARLQGEDGAWPGDYGGPMFLLPLYVALCHASGEHPRHAAEMIRYLFSVQHEDGGFGLHAEDARGSVFTTSLGYVALRALGVSREDPRATRMRRFIRERGTPLAAAPWGKLTLCLLGLYDYRGLDPILPELWLLPYAVPFHPGRLWCHCRQVYLPMAWLYGAKASIAPDALVLSLREELYGSAWDAIDWPAARHRLAAEERYRRPTHALRAARAAMIALEAVHVPALRRRALARVLEHIEYEDRVTNHIDIGPVNKVLNAFVHHFTDPGGETWRRSFSACDEYLWHGPDGTKMQSYNSSKLWDSAFAVQAVLAANGASEERDAEGSRPSLSRAYDYLRDNQILEDVPERERYHRDPSRGGFPFSNRAHGWPITDCTAEALKCALSLDGRTSAVPIPHELLRDAVELILRWQNDDGGFATYERRRGGAWLEALNPSEVFGDIMVDYSYVECTSACLQALVAAGQRFGETFGRSIRTAVRRGARFLRKAQRTNGSFEGSWGVCFTYGTWFGVSGLLASGASRSDPAVERACAFLLEKQRDDGAWGEHGDSCRERRYVPARAGSATQTAWALSTLSRARHPSASEQARAAEFLMSTQSPDGSWPEEPMVGVFNRTCLVNYANYRHYFPLWALAEWRAVNAR